MGDRLRLVSLLLLAAKELAKEALLLGTTGRTALQPPELTGRIGIGRVEAKRLHQAALGGIVVAHLPLGPTHQHPATVQAALLVLVGVQRILELIHGVLGLVWVSLSVEVEGGVGQVDLKLDLIGHRR